jgi:hypothetical protein
MKINLLLLAMIICLSSYCQTSGKIFKGNYLVLKDGKWTTRKIPIPKKSFIKMSEDTVIIGVRQVNTYVMDGNLESKNDTTSITHTWDCTDDKGRYCKFMMKILILDKLFIISIIYPESGEIYEYVTN